MTTVYNKFNRGVIDTLALSRDDVTRVNNSAELMENFIPHRLGPAQFRQGIAHIDELASVNSRFVSFFSSLDSTALLQFSAFNLRIYTNDELVTATSVTSTFTNGDFASSITGWTTVIDSGASTVHDFSSAASLTGTGSGSAAIHQTVAAEADAEHTMRIVVDEAPVDIMIGTSGAFSDEILSTTLGVGTHSLVFTPDANFTVTFENSKVIRSLVRSVEFTSTGAVSLLTTLTTDNLSTLRSTQSADVMYFAYDGGKPFKVERRGVKSWSIVEYSADDGPFGFINDSKITLTSDVLTGNGVLTASDDLFTADSVGTLYKLISAGQLVEATITAEDNGTDGVRVSGVAADRIFNIAVTGLTGSGSTVTLQRSSDDATWFDVESYTTNQSKTYDDELDNSILFYRLFVKIGDYSAGTIEPSIDYTGGSIEGICRVVNFISTTSATIQILKSLGSTDATRDWYEGEWSASSGYPSSVVLYESRLWWSGKTKLWGSVIDSFNSFDDSLEGADAPISRTVAFGPVDTVDWLAVSSRLIMGVASDEISVRSSSFGEVLTSVNINLSSGSSQGVAPIEPVRVDDDIIFVQRSGIKLYNLMYTADRDTHKSTDLNMMNQTICSEGVKRIAVVRQPETRIFAVLDDGTAAVLNYDPTENINGWSTIVTDGTITDVVVLPSRSEDRVYFTVVRDGVARLEKLSMFRDSCVCPVDAHVTYESPSTTLTGLDHLNGRTVTIWADSAYRGTAVVSSGSITIDSGYTDVAVGLPYEARYKSNKLSSYVDYSVLTRRKRVESVGIVAKQLYRDGLTMGPDFDSLQNLPTQENGKAVTGSVIVEDYDEPDFPFSGSFDTDSRVCIKAVGPVILMAVVYEILESKTKN